MISSGEDDILGSRWKLSGLGLLHAFYLMQMSIPCNLIPMGDMLDSDPTVDFLDKDVVGLNLIPMGDMLLRVKQRC